MIRPHTPIFRVLTQPQGGWNSQSWTALDMPLLINPATFAAFTGTSKTGGYRVERITRCVLPDEDHAQFSIEYGIINNTQVTPLDLSGYDVQIQVYDAEAGPDPIAGTFTSSLWKTVFVGTVVYQESKINPSSTDTRTWGKRTYFCAGILWRMRNWVLHWHRAAGGTAAAMGHPGYNAPMHGYFRQVIGNKSTDTSTLEITGDSAAASAGYGSWFKPHALPYGPGDTRAASWTDREAIRHAIASSRTKGDPIFYEDLSGGLFDGTFPWSISPGETCYDFIRRACNRNRGRGAVYVTWTQSGNNLTLFLKAKPTISAPSTSSGDPGKLYWWDKTSPTAQEAQLTVLQAMDVASTDHDVVIDLHGDARLVDDSVSVENRATSVIDCLEVLGEKVQVCTNISVYAGSLEAAWTSSDASALNAISDVTLRNVNRWRHVFRRFRVPEGWGFQTRGEPGDAPSAIDHYVYPGPTAQIGTENGTKYRCSSIGTRILPDLPIYEGWDYSVASPVRYDSSTTYLPDPRMPMIAMYKTDTDCTAPSALSWANLENSGFSYQIDDYGIYIFHYSEGSGGRVLAPTASLTKNPASANAVLSIPDCAFNGGFDYTNSLNLVVGIETGASCRIVRYTGDANGRTAAAPVTDTTWQNSRKMTIPVDGAHLWLGTPNCAFEFNAARDNHKGQRPVVKFYDSGTGAPYIIRDDRPALSQIAALAWYYYGKVHNPATWSLKACGFQTTYWKGPKDEDVAYYPVLGDIVAKLQTGDGIFETVGTPVTSIDYVHEDGITTWRTDFIQYNGTQP